MIIEKLIDHIKGNDYLDFEDIQELIKMFPDAYFHGDAYRLLLFSQETSLCLVSGDKSFSKSPKGVKFYSYGQDLGYYRFCQLYKASIKGLDLNKINHPKIDKYLKSTIEKEEEVIPLLVKSSECVFNGESMKLERFLDSMS